MKSLFILTSLLCTQVFAQSQKNITSENNWLKKLLNKDSYLKTMLDKKDSLNIQIVYTQIDRDKNNKPSFKTYSFNTDENKYFYPASTVKMPIAFLALEKLQELNIKGLDKNTTMVTENVDQVQTQVLTQPTAKDSRATISNYIKQIFLVSDNDAFNRLYEFLGQEYIQKKLTEKGYPQAMIRHRLQVSMSTEQNRQTNPISFYDNDGKLIYHQPAQTSNAVYADRNIFLGDGYMRSGITIKKPFNFSDKNKVLLQDQHSILQSVLFADFVEAKKKFNLSNDDYNFVKHWMSAYPRESLYPNYDTTNYWDAYCKFLFFGSEKNSPQEYIRIFNKVGDAYGFLTDISYLTDTLNGVEFMLSATIYCNKDGIFNDDQYDYETVGFPFMKNLGQFLYNFEKGRKKKYLPKLLTSTINYNKE